MIEQLSLIICTIHEPDPCTGRRQIFEEIRITFPYRFTSADTDSSGAGKCQKRKCHHNSVISMAIEYNNIRYARISMYPDTSAVHFHETSCFSQFFLHTPDPVAFLVTQSVRMTEFRNTFCL